MKFRRVFRGYSPVEVESRLNTLKKKSDEVQSAQRRRIEELSDENCLLNSQLQNYKIREQAVAAALVEANNQAELTRLRADNYAETVLLRAKCFSEAWRGFAKVLINSLDDCEVRQFNVIFDKLQRQIEAFGEPDDGTIPLPDIQKQAVLRHCNPIDKIVSLLEDDVCSQKIAATEPPRESSDKSGATSPDFGNSAAAKTESAPRHVIDLDELGNPTESLGELCKYLGLK